MAGHETVRVEGLRRTFGSDVTQSTASTRCAGEITGSSARAVREIDGGAHVGAAAPTGGRAWVEGLDVVSDAAEVDCRSGWRFRKRASTTT